MILTAEISRKYEDYDSYDDFNKAYDSASAHSYEEYVERGHKWCWCLIGNVEEQYYYGENYRIRYGTKQFRPRAKLFLAPAQWGDGYERVVVIGVPRHGKEYIEIVTSLRNISNFRICQVYKPALLDQMCCSKYYWWSDTDEDKNRIQEWLISYHGK